jgi:hypothetical protein
MREPWKWLALGCLAALAVVLSTAVRSSFAHRAKPELMTPAQRAGSLRFATTVTPADRRWVEQTYADLRPSARRLIDAIDGRVTIAPFHVGGVAIGLAASHPTGSTVYLDFGAIDRMLPSVREHVLTHELGHVVDYVLIPDELRDELDRQIPRTAGSPCHPQQFGLGNCAPVAERFADTFAKWALRNPAYWMPVGYRVEPPPSLDEWGRPLEALARDPFGPRS